MIWALSSRPFFSGFRITKHQLGQRPPKGRPEGRSLVGMDKALAFAWLTFRETPNTKWQGPIIFNRKGPESVCTLTLPVEMLRKRQGLAQVTLSQQQSRDQHPVLLSLSVLFLLPWLLHCLPFPSPTQSSLPTWPFLLKSRRGQVWASKLTIGVNLRFWKYGTTMEVWLTTEQVRKSAL